MWRVRCTDTLCKFLCERTDQKQRKKKAKAQKVKANMRKSIFQGAVAKLSGSNEGEEKEKVGKAVFPVDSAGGRSSGS